jgi:hypothetical protein
MSIINGGYEVNAKAFGSSKITPEMLNVDCNTVCSTRGAYLPKVIEEALIKKAFALMKTEKPELAVDKGMLGCFKMCQGALKKCKTKSGCIYSPQCRKLLGRKEIDTIIEVQPQLESDTWQVNKVELHTSNYPVVVWDVCGCC